MLPDTFHVNKVPEYESGPPDTETAVTAEGQRVVKSQGTNAWFYNPLLPETNGARHNGDWFRRISGCGERYKQALFQYNRPGSLFE